MRIAASRAPAKAAPARVSPRLYFVHIPKTAGITLKAYLENNYTHGESLVIHEWEARRMAPEALRRYRLLSGHYSSEVLEARRRTHGRWGWPFSPSAWSVRQRVWSPR